MKSPAFLIGMSLSIMAWTCVLAGDGVPTQKSAKFESSKLGNIFTENSGRLDLRVEPASQVAGVRLTVSDESGLVLQERDLDPKTSPLAIELATKGFYRLKANVRYADGTEITAQCTSAVVGPPLDDSQRLNSPFGFCTVHGNMSLAIAAGGRWVRGMPSLKDCPVPSAQTPEKQSDAIDRHAVWVLAFGLPLWMMSLPQDYRQEGFDNPFQAPKDWLQLKKTVQEFAASSIWKSFPQYFEVYNEPELTWKGSDEDLVKFHSIVAQGIKSVRPETKILGPGLATIKMDLFKKYVALGLLQDLDGVVFHPYVCGTAPEGEFIEKVAELQDYLKSIGKEDMPVFFTEFGWTTVEGLSWTPPVDEITQARYASRSLVLLSARGIAGITYFCLLFKDPIAGGFSLLNQDSTPKPGYAAFANTTRWLAGAEKKGRCLQMSPTAYLALFRKQDCLIAVAWDSKDKSRLHIPELSGRAEDMMGHAVPVKNGMPLEIWQSPIFLELKDKSLFDVKMLPEIQIMRGQKLRLSSDWGEIHAPTPLSIENGELFTPANAPLGKYILIGRKGKAHPWLWFIGRQGKANPWVGVPVDVTSPITIESAEVRWPLEEANPLISFAVRLNKDTAANMKPVIKLDKARDEFPEPFELAPKTTRNVSIKLPNLKPGTRYRGKLVVETRSDKTYDFGETPLDITIIPCFSTPFEGASPVWEKMAWIDFSSWAPFFTTNFVPGDCSGKFKAAYDSAGLHFLIHIEDNMHLQNQSPNQMWNEDSIQFAFDVDAEKQLEANTGVLRFGHRVLEYGVADKNGEPMVWRWKAYVPGMTEECPESMVKTSIGRQTDQITEYEVTFPWKSLGLDKSPQSGSNIGFALAVNDNDGDSRGRHGICLFGGIVDDTKDPKKFGALWLR